VSDPLPRLFEALERRHLAELSFQEVRRGLTALSSLYVERRGRLPAGAAFDGAGKRAAFALYYAPLHALAARETALAIGATTVRPPLLVELGCGSAAAAAGWASACRTAPEVLGVEQSGWAAGEARFTLAACALRGRILRQDLGRFRLPQRAGALLLAYTLNELDDEARERLKPALLEAAASGAQVMVLEPLARRVAPFWDAWAAAFGARGGRADVWRFRPALPERLALLGRAAGLDPRELGVRSLYLPGGRSDPPRVSSATPGPRPAPARRR
jgi:hypothetical protein